MVFVFFFLDAFASWVSGVLDPEGSASGDVVTSVKRSVLINLHSCVVSALIVGVICFNSLWLLFHIGAYGQ